MNKYMNKSLHVYYFTIIEQDIQTSSEFIPSRSTCETQGESVTSITKRYQFSYISYTKLHTLGWLNEKAMRR